MSQALSALQLPPKRLVQHRRQQRVQLGLGSTYLRYVSASVVTEAPRASNNKAARPGHRDRRPRFWRMGSETGCCLTMSVVSHLAGMIAPSSCLQDTMIPGRVQWPPSPFALKNAGDLEEGPLIIISDIKAGTKHAMLYSAFAGAIKFRPPSLTISPILIQLSFSVVDPAQLRFFRPVAYSGGDNQDAF